MSLRSLRLLGVLALSVVACRGEEQVTRQREADQLCFMVKALRDAEGSAKEPRIRALEAAACSEAKLCELRDVCVAAYRLHLTGLKASSAVRHALRQDGGSDAGQVAARLLLSASEKLDRAKRESKHCADLEASVRRDYSVKR